ncbi:hypothetical protein [Streptomyces sp. T028]|uniref:hypothetical protein n=1 Tax=Streptomyces sp. T028 TaxID=3394379 RepID=UPI003A8825DA
MSRRTNSSCLGSAVKGYALLNLWVLAGYALALPVTVPDLMASQQPPQEVHGFGQYAVLYGIPVAAAAAVTAYTCRTRPCPPWVFLARTAVVVALAQTAARWAATRFDSPDWSSRSLALSGAAGLAALLCHQTARWWDNGGLNHGRRRPAAGEIWHALVPFRESDGELPHYCVVMRPRLRHVEVLQITSQNKDDRADHIRIPNDGWDFTSGRDHWDETGLPPRHVPYEKFTKARPQGRCPKPTWKQLRAGRGVRGAGVLPVPR